MSDKFQSKQALKCCFNWTVLKKVFFDFFHICPGLYQGPAGWLIFISEFPPSWRMKLFGIRGSNQALDASSPTAENECVAP